MNNKAKAVELAISTLGMDADASEILGVAREYDLYLQQMPLLMEMLDTAEVVEGTLVDVDLSEDGNDIVRVVIEGKRREATVPACPADEQGAAKGDAGEVGDGTVGAGAADDEAVTVGEVLDGTESMGGVIGDTDLGFEADDLAADSAERACFFEIKVSDEGFAREAIAQQIARQRLGRKVRAYIGWPKGEMPDWLRVAARQDVLADSLLWIEAI